MEEIIKRLRNDLSFERTKRKSLQAELKQKEKEVEQYKQAIDKIKELINKLDIAWECCYGDYDCDNCSDLEEETVCTYKIKNTILQIINEVEDA